jgi:hypothetical protein
MLCQASAIGVMFGKIVSTKFKALFRKSQKFSREYFIVEMKFNTLNFGELRLITSLILIAWHCKPIKAFTFAQSYENTTLKIIIT